MRATIEQLITYPIKSCAGISLSAAELTNMGLSGDRQWMVVDAVGQFISQRQLPQMALIEMHMIGDLIELRTPGMPALKVQAASTTTAPVTVWKDQVTADTGHADADRWLSQYLQQPVRLVRYGDQSHRAIDPDYAKAEETVAFADGYPVLVTHMASLNDLNRRLSSAVSMSRFRPNIVLSTDQDAWSENHWSQLQLSSGHVALVKPCTRCVMTGVEQKTGINTGTEVLKTLAQEVPHQGQAVFGINGIPRLPDSVPVTLSVGQTIEVLEHRGTEQ